MILPPSLFDTVFSEQFLVKRKLREIYFDCDKDTILIFDEFLMNESWEQDEFKALNEFCAINSYTYEVVAISFFTKQVAVKLIGI